MSSHAIPIDTIDIRDASNAHVTSFPAHAAEVAAHGAVAICRSDLHAVIYSAAAAVASVRFGVTIAAVRDHGDGVTVTCSDGTRETFDLLVVAEGLHSTTRALVWPADAPHRVGVVYAAASVRGAHAAEPGTLVWYLDGTRSLAIIPTSGDTALTQAYFRGALDRGAGARGAKALLLETYADFAPEVRAIIERMSGDASIFYDDVAMVTMPRLYRGRVVLLGDAGYCPTFLSGMGASLGLVGAKALARALGDHGDVEDALAQYDARLQPLVRHFQHNAKNHVDGLMSGSHWKSTMTEWVLRALPQSLIARAFGHQYDVENMEVA